MELTEKQYKILKSLAGHEGPVPQAKIKPAAKPPDRDSLVAAKFVEAGKQKRSATLALTDTGRRYLAEHPDPPAKPRRQAKDKPPKPPKPLPTFPFPGQRVFLLKIAFAAGDGPVGGVASLLKEPGRERLIAERWVEETKAGRGKAFALTDAGWAWVADHLGDSIGGGAAGEVLGDVLARVHTFLGAKGLQLADLLRATTPTTGDTSVIGPSAVESGTSLGGESLSPPNTAAGAVASTEAPSDLVATIRDVCHRLARNALSPHVKLADLRSALASWDRATVDATLLDLEVVGRVRLVGIGDPRELRPGDREAELRTPAGAVRHLLYWTDA